MAHDTLHRNYFKESGRANDFLPKTDATARLSQLVRPRYRTTSRGFSRPNRQLLQRDLPFLPQAYWI